MKIRENNPCFYAKLFLTKTTIEYIKERMFFLTKFWKNGFLRKQDKDETKAPSHTIHKNRLNVDCFK